jgi:ABC-type dipeptide/oligopeptide/nickel transport system permease subunit
MYTLIRSKKSHKSNRSVSISISVAITIINNLVGIVIRKLTAYERNYTQIITQRSQAVKTIVSQIINMVVLNFVISGLIEKNFHNPGGLTERVFYMATTNAILSPIMKFIDWKQIFRIFRRCQRENIDNKLY